MNFVGAKCGRDGVSCSKVTVVDWIESAAQDSDPHDSPGNFGRELSDDALFQLFETLTCYGRDFNQFHPLLSTPLLQLADLRGIGGIHLRCHDNPGLLRQVRIVFRQLLFDGFEVRDRIAILCR